MNGKVNFFVYIFVSNFSLFQVTQIDILYHFNNTFQNTVFWISVDVPGTLSQRKNIEEQ